MGIMNMHWHWPHTLTQPCPRVLLVDHLHLALKFLVGTVLVRMCILVIVYIYVYGRYAIGLHVTWPYLI